MPFSLLDSSLDYKPQSNLSGLIGVDRNSTTLPISSSSATKTTTLAPTIDRLNEPLDVDMLADKYGLSGHSRSINNTSALLNSTLITPAITSSSATTTTIAANTISAGLNNNPKRNESSSDLLQQLLDDLRQIEDTVDSIEIPARGRCRVYMAKFGYDPFEQSPNENPEAELALSAGDYIMVFGDIDEDGYFIGELIDGRRGYVPSNYLDRLTGDDLLDFQANVLYKQANAPLAVTSTANNQHLHHPNQTSSSFISSQQQQHHHHSHNPLSSAAAIAANQQQHLLLSSNDFDPETNSFPPEFYEAIIGDTLNHSNFQHLHIDPEDYHRMNDYVDLEDVDEIDDECLSDYERAEAEQMRRAVAPPQRLVLERQLNKSVLISWLHPQAAKGTIVSYQIYVDGVLKSTVPSGDRTKALLEGVDSNVPHRISVRAIDLHNRHSNDAACTIVTGRQVPFAPACVKASHITSDSTLISWLPCNSNFHHVVAVNSVEVQTVRPGVYKHLINGLSANTLYRVWVRAKPGKILSVDEKNPKKLESLSTYVDFKTMPKSLPDPPVNVQVEAGPQRRTLLITWLPLTLNDFGVSNGCPITGYAVFAGHKKLADIDSPTGDHALLEISDLECLHKKSVTVRTKSGENLSQDSMPCHIPDEYLKFSGGIGSTKHQQHTDQLNHPHYATSTSGLRTGHQQQYLSSQQHQTGSIPSMHNNLTNQQRLSSSDQTQNQFAMMNNRFQSHHQSPHRQRRMNTMSRHSMGPARKYQGARQISRSLQNLESDLESRRSSIPAIEVTREAYGSDTMAHNNNPNMTNNPCESYSEEEFENSMRCRGLKGQRAMGIVSGSRGAQQRFRGSRGDSQSLDGQNRAGHQSGSLAKLRAGSRSDQQSVVGSGVAIRYFVALFDYDPSIMSPNPNAATEELAFKEGSIIKIYGDKGLDGFYHGELDGLVGFVPCNVVSEIRDPKLLFSLQEKQRQKQQQLQITSNNPTYNIGPSSEMSMNQQNLVQQQLQFRGLNQQQMIDSQQQQQQQQQQINGFRRMIALYDYDPQENSPNADTESEIPFKQGDVIYIYGKMDTDGFFMGEVERTKQRGLVPSNFLRDEMLLNAKDQQQQQPVTTSSLPRNQQQQMLISGQQQQLLQQQNPMNQANMNLIGQQIRPSGPMNPMDAFQPRGQLIQPRQMNTSTNTVNSQQLNQSPMLNQNQIRSQVQPSQQQMLQQQPGGNLINRPTSLSLINGQGQTNMTNQQQLISGQMMQSQQLGQHPLKQQQQPNMRLAQSNMMQQQPNQAMSSMNMQQANQQRIQMNPNQAQQQQQQGGGVLSNLLSSGKQIIGAATTPRGPPNQNQLIGGNQFGSQQPNNPMMQPNQMTSMDRQVPGGPANMTYHGDQSHNFRNQGQQQMNINSEQMQMNNPQLNPMISAQQAGNFGMRNPMGGGQIRGPMGSGPNMGEDQGGNILNTVKNMFKL